VRTGDEKRLRGERADGGVKRMTAFHLRHIHHIHPAADRVDVVTMVYVFTPSIPSTGGAFGHQR
jgi:hypothetical protein